MRFQPKSLLAAALLALAASPAFAGLSVTALCGGRLLPARSRARVLAISCSPADITWFAVGASETLTNSLANSGNVWRARP